jgi:hypothetical protein
MISMSLSEQDWNTVMQALGELPFRMSAPVIQRIQQQAQAHTQAQAPSREPNPTPLPAAAE